VDNQLKIDRITGINMVKRKNEYLCKSCKSYEPEPVNYFVRHQKEFFPYISKTPDKQTNIAFFALAPLHPKLRGQGQKMRQDLSQADSPNSYSYSPKGGTQNLIRPKAPILLTWSLPKTDHIYR